MKPIYLDYNATTPLDPAVIEAMLPFIKEHFGNPSSSHVYGKTAHDAVEEARRQVAALLHAEPDEIVFTGGGTEASNHALKGAVFAKLHGIFGRWARGAHIITKSRSAQARADATSTLRCRTPWLSFSTVASVVIVVALVIVGAAAIVAASGVVRVEGAVGPAPPL